MVRKSGKTKKNDKSQRRQLEMGIFEKIQKKFKKKTSDFVSSLSKLQNSLYLNTFNW